MSSISGASRAQAGAKAKAKSKPRSKANSQSKGRSKRAQSKKPRSKAKADADAGIGERLSRPDLLAVRDELDELAAMVAVLPQLHRFVAVMEEIITPRPDSESSHDRISAAVADLPHKQQNDANKALDKFTSQDRIADVDLMDMKSGLEAMARSIECRLHRVCGLLAVA